MNLKVIALGSQLWERKIFRWGLSFLVGKDILFDTFGREDVFATNIKKFGIDVAEIKHIIISHSHWDHTRGLFYLVHNYSHLKFKTYILKDFGSEFKSRVKKFQNLEVIEENKSLRIKSNIYTTGKINFTAVPEQALVIEKKPGLTVITGCAHPGIVKMVNSIRRKFGKEIIFLIGGFHLKDKNKYEIVEIVNKLKDKNINKVAPTHCTGEIAVEYFQKLWGNNFVHLQEGMEIEV